MLEARIFIGYAERFARVEDVLRRNSVVHGWDDDSRLAVSDKDAEDVLNLLDEESVEAFRVE